MHCQQCDRLLTDEESTRKDDQTGQYLDTCSECMNNLYEDMNDDILDDLDDSYSTYEGEGNPNGSEI